MRILIVDSDYPRFLETFYERRPGLAEASYEEQMASRRDELFGIAEAYATHLNRLGHETTTLYWNNDHAHRAWAREHGWSRLRARLGALTRCSSPRNPRTLVRAMRLRGVAGETWQILAAQIRAYAPDVLICLDVGLVIPQLLSELRNSVGLIVGQHAASPLATESLGCYDLFVSSVPAIVHSLRDAGLRAEPLRLGFDTDVLAKVPEEPLVHDISFVGSFFPGLHDSRIPFLERLCDHFQGMRIWSSSIGALSTSSPIRRGYVGEAWGVEMFRTLRRSRITVNRHVDFFPYANNMRLYEATGCSALLVTDAKKNLSELFRIGSEILAYETVDDCIELIERYLSDEPARAAIARAGHERTMRDHTYEQRMEELLDMLAVAARPPRRPQPVRA